MSERARPRIPGVVWVGALVLGLAALAVIVSGGGPSAPAVFMALALGMLLLALAALYQSLRSAFSDSSSSVGLRTRLPERASLLDEKDALLRAIKDIAFEHEVGKLSDDDFARLNRSYRIRAKEVLQKLDEDLAPYFERAERMVDGEMVPSDRPARKKKGKKARRACPSCGTSNATAAKWCKECGGPMELAKCPACGADNEPDAKFCSECAKPMRAGSKNAGEAGASASEARADDASPGPSNESAAGDASGAVPDASESESVADEASAKGHDGSESDADESIDSADDASAESDDASEASASADEGDGAEATDDASASAREASESPSDEQEARGDARS